MTKTKRIGVEIDPEVWEQFRTFVKVHNRGRVRGVLSIELENAIENYMGKFDNPVPAHDHYNPGGDAFDHDTKKETPTNEDHHADSSYAAIYADLHGIKQIRREEFEGILTRRLGLKTDKSRRDHLKTFEHLGILEPHPAVGHKILTVNQDFMNLP